MSRCSTCGGTRVDNILRHRPGCPCYRSADMFVEHDDLIELDAELSYWWPWPDETEARR